MSEKRGKLKGFFGIGEDLPIKDDAGEEHIWSIPPLPISQFHLILDWYYGFGKAKSEAMQSMVEKTLGMIFPDLPKEEIQKIGSNYAFDIIPAILRANKLLTKKGEEVKPEGFPNPNQEPEKKSKTG